MSQYTAMFLHSLAQGQNNGTNIMQLLQRAEEARQNEGLQRDRMAQDASQFGMDFGLRKDINDQGAPLRRLIEAHQSIQNRAGEQDLTKGGFELQDIQRENEIRKHAGDFMLPYVESLAAQADGGAAPTMAGMPAAQGPEGPPAPEYLVQPEGQGGWSPASQPAQQPMGPAAPTAGQPAMGGQPMAAQTGPTPAQALVDAYRKATAMGDTKGAREILSLLGDREKLGKVARAAEGIRTAGLKFKAADPAVQLMVDAMNAAGQAGDVDQMMAGARAAAEMSIKQRETEAQRAALMSDPNVSEWLSKMPEAMRGGVPLSVLQHVALNGPPPTENVQQRQERSARSKKQIDALQTEVTRAREALKGQAKFRGVYVDQEAADKIQGRIDAALGKVAELQRDQGEAPAASGAPTSSSTQPAVSSPQGTRLPPEVDAAKKQALAVAKDGIARGFITREEGRRFMELAAGGMTNAQAIIAQIQKERGGEQGPRP